MFEIVFLSAVSVYFIATVILSVGLTKKFNKLADEELPFASVIVAARNEEQNISECLQALSELEYPVGKIEIIIADDASTDSTNEIVRKFIENKPKFNLIEVTDDDGKLKGKANAISQAIKIAKGEIILTTDADCVVNPFWAKTIASYYSGNTGVVCGFTLQENENLFSAMQSVDLIYLLSVAAGSMNKGNPVSAIGNNMSYRKKAYTDAGGYEAIPFSVTEDYSLIKAVDGLKKFKLIYPVDPDSLIHSKSCTTLGQLFHQKKRWAVGGLGSDLKGFIVMFTGWFANFMLFLSVFFFTKTVLIIAAFKILTDFFFLSGVYKNLTVDLKILHFATAWLYQVVYIVFLPAAVLFSRKVKWKEREF